MTTPGNMMTCIAKAALSAILLAVSSAVPAQEEPLETIPVDQAPEESGVSGASKYPYTYAAARLRHTEYDRHAADGIAIEGSYLLLPNVFGIAAVSAGETDDTNPVEFTQFELGAGYRMALMSDMELNVALRLLKLNTKTDERTGEELGYQLDAGVRATLLEKLETSGGVSYIEIDESSHAYLTASALYEVLPKLGLGVEGAFGSDSYSYGLLGRWAF